MPVAILFAIFFGVHVAIRFLAPYADPVLLPTVALINGLGVAFLRRLDLGAVPPEQRADLTVFSGIGDPADRVDRRRRGRRGAAAPVRSATTASLSRYAYTLGLVGIVLVMIPALLPAQYSVDQRRQAVDPHRRLLDPAG